jgi:hypothetical protein
MKLWLKQYFCFLRGHGDFCYETVRAVGRSFPTVTVITKCSRCDKTLSVCEAPDWDNMSAKGKIVFNKETI